MKYFTHQIKGTILTQNNMGNHIHEVIQRRTLTIEETAKQIVDSIYNTIQLSYDSDGKLMTKKELHARIKMLARLQVNFLIEYTNHKPLFWPLVIEQIDQLLL